MSKYIDAEKLISEIERRMSENIELAKTADCFGHNAVEDNDILSLIESLQHEQESIAERFARIVRGNLIGIDKEVQHKFEQLFLKLQEIKCMEGTMTKYIDADRLREKITDRLDLFRELSSDTISPIRIDECKQIIDIITSLQQEQPEVDLDKLVNEEFSSHSRTTEYGLEVTYNRNELYQLIKKMALLFNARKEE